MENKSRRRQLMPIEQRERMLKQGNKEASAKTQPSKLTDTEKFECALKYQKQNLGGNPFRSDYIECFRRIYDEKSIIGQTGAELEGLTTTEAREFAKWIIDQKKWMPPSRPLAKLIEAEQRING